MKVSSAIKNNPNCIKSIKLNLFFIGTTSILCRMKVNPPCNTIVPKTKIPYPANSVNKTLMIQRSPLHLSFEKWNQPFKVRA